MLYTLYSYSKCYVHSIFKANDAMYTLQLVENQPQVYWGRKAYNNQQSRVPIQLIPSWWKRFCCWPINVLCQEAMISDTTR